MNTTEKAIIVISIRNLSLSCAIENISYHYIHLVGLEVIKAGIMQKGGRNILPESRSREATPPSMEQRMQ